MEDINKNTLFRFLYELDSRDLPSSIKRWLDEVDPVDSEPNKDRFSALDELYPLKGKCRNLVCLSKTFVDVMDRSYLKFTHLHIDILEQLEGECGVVQSPYFLPGSYVVYKIENGYLKIWVFHGNIAKHISVPTFQMTVKPKDRIEGKGHQLDIMVTQFISTCVEPNIRDYIDMVLDYLCLREWADVEIKNILTYTKKEVKKNKKCEVKTVSGLEYYTFDSRWYTELHNDNDFLVSGHFRLQPYADGVRRLIWIDEFTKHGYHRKATIDKVKDGDIELN